MTGNSGTACMYLSNAVTFGNACLQCHFGAHFGSFEALSWQLLGYILGSKTAPDRNSIGIPEIVAFKAPLRLDLVGFWVPLVVPFLDHVGLFWL